jgi:hypothetical protein
VNGLEKEVVRATESKQLEHRQQVPVGPIVEDCGKFMNVETVVVMASLAKQTLCVVPSDSRNGTIPGKQ